MDPTGVEAETVWVGQRLPPAEGNGDEADGSWLGEEAEIRLALGVETAYGYHVEDRRSRHGARDDVLAVDDVAPAPRGGRGMDAAQSCAARGSTAPAGHAEAFPCIDDHRYDGCLGAACPLETCWTGGTTVSFARKQREESRVSTALYLPGAPCHTCAHLAEDEVAVPAPRAIGQPGATRAALRKARASRAAPAEGAQNQAPATVRLCRVICAQGLWAHPISLSSFLMKRIPMLDQVEPAQCPGYMARPEPHPAVVAHLQRRRERAQRIREERRAAGAARLSRP